MGGVPGGGDVVAELGIGNRRANDGLEGDYAGPAIDGVVVEVVFGGALADFGGGLGERHSKYGSGFEFPFVRVADLVPAAGSKTFGEGVERGDFFFVGGEKRAMTEDDDRAVVHGVIEGGTGEDEAVDVGDRDADIGFGAEGAQHAAGGGAVDI